MHSYLLISSGMHGNHIIKTEAKQAACSFHPDCGSTNEFRHEHKLTVNLLYIIKKSSNSVIRSL